MLQSPCVCRRSSAVTENSVGLGQGRPFQTAFWPWSVRPTGSGKEGRSRTSCFESPAGPPVMTEADGNLRARTVLPSVAPITSRSEPILAFPLPPEPPTCPARPSAASTSARCEPFPPNRLTPASRETLGRHYGSGRTKTGSLLLNTKASQEAARFRGALKTVRQTVVCRTEPPVLRIRSAKPMLPEPFCGSLFSQLLSRDSPRGRGDSSPPRRSRDRCVPCRSCRARRRPDWSRPSCRSPLWPSEASLCGCR